MLSSNVLFCPTNCSKLNNIQFLTINKTEKLKTLTFEWLNESKYYKKPPTGFGNSADIKSLVIAAVCFFLFVCFFIRIPISTSKASAFLPGVHPTYNHTHHSDIHKKQDSLSYLLTSSSFRKETFLYANKKK